MLSKFSLVKFSALLLVAALVLATGHAEAGWRLVDDFEGLTAGTIIDGTVGPGASWDGQNNDNSGPADNTAEVDPDNGSNLAMIVRGDTPNVRLRAQLNNNLKIKDGDVGTLFYRFRTPAAADGTTDHVVGLTDNPALTNFNFKSGLRNTVVTITDPNNPREMIAVNNMDARDQGNLDGAYQHVTHLLDNTWYNLWMVSTNTSPGGFHELFLQSDGDPAYATQTQLQTTLGDPTFNYRIDDPSDIVNVYFRSASNGGGTALSNLYFDDIWVNNNARSLTAPTVPEPTALVLAAAGLGTFLMRRR